MYKSQKIMLPFIFTVNLVILMTIDNEREKKERRKERKKGRERERETPFWGLPDESLLFWLEESFENA